MFFPGTSWDLKILNSRSIFLHLQCRLEHCCGHVWKWVGSNWPESTSSRSVATCEISFLVRFPFLRDFLSCEISFPFCTRPVLSSSLATTHVRLDSLPVENPSLVNYDLTVQIHPRGGNHLGPSSKWATPTKTPSLFIPPSLPPTAVINGMLLLTYESLNQSNLTTSAPFLELGGCWVGYKQKQSNLLAWDQDYEERIELFNIENLNVYEGLSSESTPTQSITAQ